jgi:GH15 family glucan-1,4-alpha-glucosidase
MIGDAGWTAVAEIVDWLCENWDQPDERRMGDTRRPEAVRVRPAHAGWRSIAIRIARNRSYPASLDRWTTERDRIYCAIRDKGWNDELKAFVQYEGSDVLDASLLLMPLMGFISPVDPTWVSTLQAMDRTLVSDSLVYRYDPKASPDGLQGSEGTFSICTFWYVSALARSGRLRTPD